MKLAKLSLAAIVVAGLATSSFAADTLEGAFKEGKVSGALKAWYWDRDRQAGDGPDGISGTGDDTVAGSTNILNTGLMLNYVTGSFYGLSAAFTAQASAAPFASAKAKGETTPVYTANFSGDEYGSGAVLSEAYLAYTMKNTTALVGRMFLDTPLVASSGSRMIKQAFEGIAVINKDLPNTTLIAGYVQKFQNRTDGAGKIGNFEKSFGTGSGYADGVALEDGGYTIAAINKSIAGLTLTAAYADAIDAVKIVYAEAAYEGKASSFTYGLAAQYYYNDFDNAVGGDSVDLFGVKGTLGVGSLTGTVAYTTTGNLAATHGVGGLVSGLGGSADLAYAGSPILSDSYAAGVDSYKVSLDYAINANATIGTFYVLNDFADNSEVSYIGLVGSYAFDGALKGLAVDVIYDDADKDGDASELRVQANYKF